METFIVNDNRTMLSNYMMSLKSDIMDSNIAWCRFASSKNENLSRKNHKHIVHEMHFVLSGKIKYDFQDLGSLTAGPDNFVIIPKGVMHTVTAENGSALEYLVIAFTVSTTNESINSIFSEDGKPMTAAFTRPMRSMIESLEQKHLTKNFNSSLSTKLLIHSILLESVDGLTEELGLNSLPARISSQKDVRIDAIVNTVNSNIYSEKLRGEDVAEMLGLSTRQLNRISNQYFGCSINAYITQRRIKEMQNLLEFSAHSLSDIGEIFGFPDVYAFIRHFTHFVGESPGKYRKSTHGKNADASATDGTPAAEK